ncbi:MipA/OmpV family protein [Aliidiomarina iranensis]|nr:MipA/OmpV family protein [Aliidiomarina iranensis]
MRHDGNGIKRAKSLGLAAFLLGGLSVSMAATAQESEEQRVGGRPLGFSLGFGVISSNPSYVGMDADVIAVPFIGYEGENYYFRGLTFGRHLIQSRTHELSAVLAIEPFRFKPKESDNQQIQQLDRRKFSLGAGINYRFNSRYGSIATSLSTDVSGRHDGQRLRVRYSFPLNQPGQAWQLSPEIGVTVVSKDYVRYYFGVDAAESAVSGLPEYSGDHAINPEIGIGGYYMFSERLSVTGNISFSRSDSAIANSPMVSSRSARSIILALSYRF